MRNFENQRQNLFRALSFISVITLDTLLYGCLTFDNERNTLIINAVLLFIDETKRFDSLFLLCNKRLIVQTKAKQPYQSFWAGVWPLFMTYDKTRFVLRKFKKKKKKKIYFDHCTICIVLLYLGRGLHNVV